MDKTEKVAVTPEETCCNGKCGGSCGCSQDSDKENEEAATEAAEDSAVENNDRIGELEQVIAENQDKYLRLQAEFDNFRRRTLKEKEELFNRATEEVICKLLPVIDNFERGLENGDSDAASIAKGLELIHRQFTEFLDKVGVEKVEACGCEFDPNLHNAVMRVESEEHPDNTVVEEMQKGYTLRGKVIRPSMVKVTSR